MQTIYLTCDSFLDEISNHDDDLLRFPQRALTFPNSGAIVIEQSINDVGTTLWDSEIILAHYMDDLELCGKQILEIGAGTALCAIVANRRGALVCVQDLEEVLGHTSNCLTMNDAKVEMFGCKWGLESGNLIASKHSYYDFIVMSDVLYNPDNFEELLDTIVACMGTGTRMIIVYEKRRLDLKPFFKMLYSHFTPERNIVYEVVNPQNGRKVEFHLYQLTSKK